MTTELQNKSNTPKYLKPKEAAEFLRSAVPTLAKWRHDGTGPSYSKLDSGSILYDIEILIKFVENNRISTVF